MAKRDTILAVLVEHTPKGGIGATAAAQAAGTSRQTATLTLRKLQEEGLAKRTGGKRGPSVRYSIKGAYR